MLDFNMSHRKMSGCVSFPLFGGTLVIKLRNFNFESHWNSLILFDKKVMVSDLNMSQGKMFDFLSFQLIGFTLVIKLRSFDFESHWNTLIYFDKKRCGVRFEYVLWKNILFSLISIIWVHFSHKTEKVRF